MDLKAKGEQLLSLLRSKFNLEILALLSNGPSYPREIAQLLQSDETDVARRLRKMERLGLVKAKWVRLGDRNVKMYELNVQGFDIRFRGGGVEIQFSTGDKASIKLELSQLPLEGHLALVGREQELVGLASTDTPVVHIWGLPGVGKSALTYWYVKKYAQNKPILWHKSTALDTPDRLLRKLLLFISLKLGEGVFEESPHRVARIVSETGIQVIIDDYHKLNVDTKRLVLELVSEVERPARFIIISRGREKGLPYWKGKVYELEVKPLNYTDSLKLATILAEEQDIPVDPQDLKLVARRARGLPLLIVGSFELRKSTGLPLRSCVERVVQAYYSSGLGGHLGRSDIRLLEMLHVAGGALPLQALCQALGERRRQCIEHVEATRRLGVVEVFDEMVSLRDVYSGVVQPPGGPSRDVARRVALALLEMPEAELKMAALEIMGSYCVWEEGLRVVSERVSKGSSWVVCCPERYLKALESMLTCRKLPATASSLFRAEKALIGYLTLQGDTVKAANEIASLLPTLAPERPVYSRLAALVAGLMFKIGRVEEGRALLRAARETMRGLPWKTQKAILSTYLSSDTILAVYYDKDYERAMRDAEKEADIELELGDIGNYAIGLTHIAQIAFLAGDTRKLRDTIERLDEAISVLRGTITLILKVRRTLFKSYEHLLLGNYQEALKLLNSIDPAAPGARLLHEDIELAKAVALALLGQKQEAAAVAERVLEEGVVEDLLDDEILLARIIMGTASEEDLPESIAPGIRVLIERLLEKLDHTGAERGSKNKWSRRAQKE
ncbi:MAG: winged helix-turn-helix domain-containing protein [Desulfurococcales archaeon]|nr:winged helix-turn-helix domain-containing protein [Desulfurococcales archaeon]